MKVTIEAYVTWRKYEWENEPRFTLDSADMTGLSPAYVSLYKQSFEVEVPDNFDPRPHQVKALREEKRRIVAEAEAKATNIEEQIQRLLCLEAPKEVA